MLRSMIIGLAIAALLQIGGNAFSPPSTVSVGEQRIDWVKVQTDALARLLCNGLIQFKQ